MVPDPCRLGYCAMTASLQRFLESLTWQQVVTTIVGIVLIGAAFFVAVRVELTTVLWLLDNFISYFIILIIVVFQQDIRRALGRIGQNVMPFGRRQETSQIVDEVVAATAQLARARMGAIIVFERDAALEDFVDDATRIDAILSRQLLVSLFVPAKDNELHDGAVVINKNH